MSKDRALPADAGLLAPERQAAPLSAPEAASPDAFEIPWQTISSGGGPSSSTNYETNSTAGQSLTGAASSTNYEVGMGYWYGATAGGGACACDCQGDESCDGQPNVFDVVFAVGEAFRNDPYTPDPNPLCPLAGMNDLNLDGDVNVFDVVFLVNMAFRNGLREDNVCDPCTEVGPPSCPF